MGVDAKGLEYTFDIKVKNPILWELGEGGLYDLLIEVCDADDVIDSCTVRVGIRTVDVVGHEFHINGKPFYFPGFGMHEDHGTIGKGHSDALMVRDFELLSWIGANSLRTSHYPYAEEVLDYADEHGVVVIDKAAAVGMNKVVGATFGGKIDRVFGPDDVSEETQAAHAAHLSELVAWDKNHPSVVMWSIANEPESHTEESEAYFAPLFEITRRLDPTRPVGYVNIQFSPASDDRLAKYSDALMINRYYGWYTQTGHISSGIDALDQELTDWEAYGKPIIVTEFGADPVAGLHSLTGAMWSEEFQVEIVEAYLDLFDLHPGVQGEHLWNFADFQTGHGIVRVGVTRRAPSPAIGSPRPLRISCARPGLTYAILEHRRTSGYGSKPGLTQMSGVPQREPMPEWELRGMQDARKERFPLGVSAWKRVKNSPGDARHLYWKSSE